LRILKKGITVTDPDDKNDDDHMQLLAKTETKLMIIDVSNSSDSIQPDTLAEKYTSSVRMILNDKSIDPIDIAEIRIVPRIDEYCGICVIGSEISLQFTYSFNSSKYIKPNDPTYPLSEMEFVRLFRAFLKVFKRKFLTRGTINVKKKGSKSSIISQTSTFSRVKL
jgi:hypothetical protein